MGQKWQGPRTPAMPAHELGAAQRLLAKSTRAAKWQILPCREIQTARPHTPLVLNYITTTGAILSHGQRTLQSAALHRGACKIEPWLPSAIIGSIVHPWLDFPLLPLTLSLVPDCGSLGFVLRLSTCKAWSQTPLLWEPG